MPLVPFCLLLILACPAFLTMSASQNLQTGGNRAPRDTKPDTTGQPFKVVISEACVQGDSSDSSQTQGRELDLEPGSPLVLTHRIRLIPGSCGGGCEAGFTALRDRLERLEKEVSVLREKCGGPDGGCCTSQQSKGVGCTIQQECPNECSDQGRCEDGKCVCFPGFSGADCSSSNCPGNCNDKGRCVNGQCACDPGFTGPDCSSESCPGNCNNKGRCVDGRCVCNQGFTGPDCTTKSCPGNCNNKGQCVDGRCVCNQGFTGPDCTTKSCPGNCNNKGQCVDGRCVCNQGFTGPDCTTKSCPRNCNNKGRCVDGHCVCNDGFGGPDCSAKACPDNCKNRGKCVNGRCVCDSGFTGPDCSTKSCPGNCSNRGKCVNGQCVCDSGFMGLDCSAKACPKNCSNKGRCVNGKCVCEVGFTGQDCATIACPNNCSNKGRCVKGRCVCQRGFAAPDCNQCESGFSGLDCGTAMSGVSGLQTKDITDASVTLFWSPPPVQYDNYHVTFTSQKDGDQQITSEVEGRLTAYTQTGLAAGQEYTVTIRGEIHGRMGAESTAEFTTLISGPSNLHIVKTSTTSVVVQWEQAQGEIDRYRLTVAPNHSDGKAKGRQELTLPSERDSAQIEGLDPGELYDITLVAERGRSKSKPATVQVTPGKSTTTTSTVTMETVTTQVAPGVKIQQGDAARKTTHVKANFNMMPMGEGPEIGKNLSGPGSANYRTNGKPSGATSTRPFVNRKHNIASETYERATLDRRPQTGGSIRLIGTKGGQGGWRVGKSGLTKPANRRPFVGLKKTFDVDTKSKGPIVGSRNIALNVKDTTLETSLLGENNGTLAKVYSGNLVEIAKQKSGYEQTMVIPGLKDQSDTKNGRETEISESSAGRKDLDHATRTGENTTVPSNPTSSSASPEAPTSYMLQSNLDPEKHDKSKTGTDQNNNNSTKALSVPRVQLPDRPPTSSSESDQSVKQDHSSSSTSKKLDSTKGNVAMAEDGVIRHKDRTTDGVSSGTEQNKTVAVGGMPPLRRLPPKWTRNQRLHPNMGPFQNRTRPNLRPPQHPSRVPVRRPLAPKLTNTDNSIIVRTTQPKEKGTHITSHNQTNAELKPKYIYQRKNPIVLAQGSTHGSNNSSLRQRGNDSKIGDTENGAQVDKTTDSRGSRDEINGSDFITRLKTGQPLSSIGVQRTSSGGFLLVWGAPEGMYRTFIVNREEHRNRNSENEGNEDNEDEGDNKAKTEEGNERNEERQNGGKENVDTKSDNRSQSSNSNATAKVGEGRIIKVSKVLPGTARSFTFHDLQPQTRYSLSVFGKGPEIRSQIHRLIVQTGPEPPSNLVFHNITDTSLSVSWTKPKRPVSGFRVTYTNKHEAEHDPVLVDSGDSTLELSKLSPGSSYEFSVISILGLDESDPIRGLVMTLPDPPTHLRAINVTDSKALLLWRPALATVDRYVIVYGSEKGPGDVKMTVLGNVAEQHLTGLQQSTKYTVTVTSQLGKLESSPASAVFTTRGSEGDEGVLRDLKASQVTPRSALLTWKAPSAVVGSYRLRYQTEGQKMQEVTIDSNLTEFKLTGLDPMSKYTAQLQRKRGGSYSAALSTQFTTGNLRYPFPTDCSQELLNRFRESGQVEIFPAGKQGKSVLVYCDQVTDGGGWTVFQRRMNGKTDFFRGWKDYSKGFGELTGEFWLGNENLHNLTSMAPMTLRVDLRAGDESVFAKYSTFTVDSFRKTYTLKVSGYSGTAGDSMSYHSGRPFSTKDREFMPFITRCSMSYRGGWWYKNCHEANLNGLYNINVNQQGVTWAAWKGRDFSIPFTEMKFRPTSFTPPTQG